MSSKNKKNLELSLASADELIRMMLGVNAESDQKPDYFGCWYDAHAICFVRGEDYYAVLERTASIAGNSVQLVVPQDILGDASQTLIRSGAPRDQVLRFLDRYCNCRICVGRRGKQAK